jgi:hypothetical protein
MAARGDKAGYATTSPHQYGHRQMDEIDWRVVLRALLWANNNEGEIRRCSTDGN